MLGAPIECRSKSCGNRFKNGSQQLKYQIAYLWKMMEQIWNLVTDGLWSHTPWTNLEQSWNENKCRTKQEQATLIRNKVGTNDECGHLGLCCWNPSCTILEQSGWNLAFQVCAGLQVRTEREQSVTRMEHYRNKLWMGTYLEQTGNIPGTYSEQTWNFHSNFVPDLHSIGAPNFF